jgi:hypothetical protein
MAKFEVNKPIAQADAVIRVDVLPTAPLPLGPNRFRLVVVDDAGNESEPAFIEVIVQDKDKPTAVLDVVDENLKKIDPIVPAGRSFTLSGVRSTDIAPGKIKEYRFTLLGA